MTGDRPPYRADHVGSLLRSSPLKQARLLRQAGKIGPSELKAVEDAEILKIIRKQEEVGLKAVTDGEYRRAFWQIDFLENLAGVESYEGERKVKFQGPQPRPILLRVNRKLGEFSGHPMIEHFRFVQAHTRRTPKMCIPSPTSLHFRYGREAIPESIYPDMKEFYQDLGASYRKAIAAFAEAGCRYLQIDEVNLAYLCDPALREQVRARGDDPDVLLNTYADLINAAIADAPDDMVLAMHLCRGNFRSTHVASGGYDLVADVLFNRIGVDVYFMEYDSERAGSFEPLRHLPKGKTAVLGLITTKTGALESKDELKRRIEDATRHAPLQQLALSPQCGFASTEEGNVLSDDEMWAKLRLCVEVATEVWGGV
jgi:5-methyltetrahydropteroyltriglutamate--homocysteine methyltransferase